MPSGWGSTITKRLVSPGIGREDRDLQARAGSAAQHQVGAAARAQRDLGDQVAGPDAGGVDDGAGGARCEVAPVSSSRSSTAVPVADSTRARVRTWAPYDAAVRATVVTRRASSSSWPSQDSSPPRSPAGRSGGRELERLGRGEPARARQGLGGGAGAAAQHVAGEQPGAGDAGLEAGDRRS